MNTNNQFQLVKIDLQTWSEEERAAFAAAFAEDEEEDEEEL